jgi:hypothetical protein
MNDEIAVLKIAENVPRGQVAVPRLEYGRRSKVELVFYLLGPVVVPDLGWNISSTTPTPSVRPFVSSSVKWSRGFLLLAPVQSKVFALVFVSYMPRNDMHLLRVGALVFLGRLRFQICIWKLMMNLIDGNECSVLIDRFAFKVLAVSRLASINSSIESDSQPSFTFSRNCAGVSVSGSILGVLSKSTGSQTNVCQSMT